MKLKNLLLSVALLLVSAPLFADVPIYMRVSQGDTTYFAYLHEVYVYPPMKFTSVKQEKFYWKTVRDVKKTLPYAKMAAKVMNEANEELSKMTSNKEKRMYLDAKEKDLFKNFEKDLRSMTRSQGKILIRLIDRECEQTSYEIIQIYRGSVAAVFWQGIAHLFGADLKAEYDGADKDKIIERIINLVEAGQL
ncbi:MAG: DUF4294 domain-containing protein [Bacteroidales bacterium]|nr:DUF4294 domain-containing protein [Bacteroidales bacterium]